MLRIIYVCNGNFLQPKGIENWNSKLSFISQCSPQFTNFTNILINFFFFGRGTNAENSVKMDLFKRNELVGGLLIVYVTYTLYVLYQIDIMCAC